jgi:hypothetical protein
MAQFKIPSQPKEIPPFRLSRIDGGLNLRDEQSNILDNQSPYCLNTTCDDRGALSKRPGQELLYLTSLGAGAIHLYTDYHKRDGTIKTLLHHGTKLYTQSGTDQPIEISTGLSDTEGAAFVFNDLFYYILPSGFYQYDGTTITTITAYTPTMLINCNPTVAGSGDTLEDANFLSNSWKQKFSYTDAATTVFYMKDNCDSARAWINGTETTNFTIDATDKRKITFAVAPGAGTNHVVIQGTKANFMDPNNILKCKYFALYGGENDTRVHLTGNPDHPATVYRSNVMDATYWPEQSSGAVGNDSDHNTGFLVYMTSLLLFKERSVWRDNFSLDSTGKAIFDWRPIHSTIGCDMPKSIQMIANYPVFCNSYKGAFIVVATSVREEKNVMPISGNINGAPYRPGLLDETKENLISSSSVDFDNKYLLNVGTNIYVWDYALSPYQGNEDVLAWFKWDNFNANTWIIRDRELYYGKRDLGDIVHIMLSTSIHADVYHRLNDFGAAINGVWRSKLLHFGYSEWLKTIKEVYFRMREVENTSVVVRILDGGGNLVETVPLICSSFNWDRFSWDLFSWSVMNVPPTFKWRPKLKKTVYFQIEVSNDEPNLDFPLMDLVIYHTLTKKVK